MHVSEICRYCGGVVRMVPASKVYGIEAARRLHLTKEWFFQCQNCNARVGCHRGTKRPLGNIANEVLRLKRMETHQVFDGFWQSSGMTRSAAYRWLAEKMSLTEKQTHIGGVEMDQCQQVIDICRCAESEEAA